jgi:hypothetical protein
MTLKYFDHFIYLKKSFTRILTAPPRLDQSTLVQLPLEFISVWSYWVSGFDRQSFPEITSLFQKPFSWVQPIVCDANVVDLIRWGNGLPCGRWFPVKHKSEFTTLQYLSSGGFVSSAEKFKISLYPNIYMYNFVLHPNALCPKYYAI